MRQCVFAGSPVSLKDMAINTGDNPVFFPPPHPLVFNKFSNDTPQTDKDEMGIGDIRDSYPARDDEREQ